MRRERSEPAWSPWGLHRGVGGPGPGQGPQVSSPSHSRFVVVVIVVETLVIQVTVLLLLQLDRPQCLVRLVAADVGALFFLFVRPGDRFQGAGFGAA